jgi:hypothetical protein
MNEKLFYTKSNQRDDFSEGYLYTDIYMTPWNMFQDTVKIAAYTDIVAVSPDGQYFLSKRCFDLPNRPYAIIQVSTKKYQLLLGRDYSRAKAFYSYRKKKFAFDFGGMITYIDFPKEHPFDALRWNNPDIPDLGNTEFYKQFEHKPFNN